MACLVATDPRPSSFFSLGPGEFAAQELLASPEEMRPEGAMMWTSPDDGTTALDDGGRRDTTVPDDGTTALDDGGRRDTIMGGIIMDGYGSTGTIMDGYGATGSAEDSTGISPARRTARASTLR